MAYKFYCQHCKIPVTKKEIKRHQKYGHQVIEMRKEKSNDKIDIVTEVLDELRNGKIGN